MQARHECGEVTVIVTTHDQFTVEHATRGKRLADGLGDLREVAGEGALVAAAQIDLVVGAERKASEAVPFGLVAPFVVDGKLASETGEHGFNRRLEAAHLRCPTRSGSRLPPEARPLADTQPSAAGHPGRRDPRWCRHPVTYDEALRYLDEHVNL